MFKFKNFKSKIFINQKEWFITQDFESQTLMKDHHINTAHAHKKSKFKSKYLLLFGISSLLWLIFRTGTKPSRIIYPCQRAALANSSILLSISIPLSLTSVFFKTKKFFSKKGTAIALLIILSSVVLNGNAILRSIQLVSAADPNQEIQLTLNSRTALAFPASDIYIVNGRANSHIYELVNLMGSHGLLFYKSDTPGVNQGPNGLISPDDIVLIKINEEWPYRGGTNTDILKELIQAVISHPDGFIGEIVVADNGQWQGSMDWSQSNAEDITQSTQDVVNMFTPNYNVSTYSWIPIRGNQVDEYSEGDATDGYILYGIADPETGIYVSYPKFRTQYGTYISFKHGIWNGDTYEKRLKVINMPVLKSHSSYGVTASLKHYMGVQSQGEGQAGLGNGHSTVATGGMGTLMVETGLPTLNIIDAIWVNANPPPYSGHGPSTPYTMATRINVLMGSTDPVALDYWAAKNVLMQTAVRIGYTDTHAINPDSTDKSGVSEAFGVWLDRTKNEIIASGYDVTTDENYMNVYVKSEAPPPEIGIPFQEPPRNNVLADEEVKVSVNVTDAESGVKNVTLFYAINNRTTWENRTMNYNPSTSLYEATIAGQPFGTWVKFKIVAYNNAGKYAIKDGTDAYYTYQVIPEFPSIQILLILFMLTTILVIVYRRRY